MCLNPKNETVFLDGLRKIKSKGVVILVDGSEDETKWRDMLVCQEESYYNAKTYDDPDTNKLSKIEFVKVQVRC